jgi:tetratricopeptide (TPR) repeat protein
MHSRIYDGEAILRQAVKSLAPLPSEKPHPTWALALLSWYDHSTYIVRFEKGGEIESQARSCLEHAKSIRDSQGIAASLVLLGAIAEDQGNFEAAIHDYEEAMRVDPSLDDMYWVVIRIGLCHQAARQYPEAIQAFRLGLQRAQRTGERVKAAWSLLNIGDTLLCKKPVEARAS